ncbi:hypothetical protein PHLCEN_2v348 [Hermanssonia centrifuga]|uniref:SH3 domain-containing protein n=1 Tax=Hermanssonia centrifuga TaxID=98765 RepID=A0A2R6S6F8_9APHY|nr:hypothetical protein PHLCEN_2v348 [Hermanssonia centrifuga]
MSSLCVFLFLYPTLSLASLPLIDFNRMGKVGLAGAFAGLDLFDNSSSTVSFDSSTSTLLSRAADGSLSRLGSTNAGGSILAGCALGSTFYIAGSFSSIGGTSANNVASYDPSSGSFAALGSGGPNGELHAIFCDDAQKKVWVGGQFTSPSPAVAVWDTGSSSWSAPPFGGLSGASAEVSSITTNSSQSSLFFSGSFVTLFGNSSQPINDTNNPNVPFSTGATPFSSSLVPIPLGNAQITASPSSTETGFSNIMNILCPAGSDGPGNTWFAQDGGKAVITVREFAYLTARGIRLGNTFLNHGTTGFSVTTIPDNTVQTLQFTDPNSGQNSTCTDPCPLLTDPSVPYQDFLFDDDVAITGFQLTLEEWTGAAPGLHILQLLSSGAFASSISADNGDSCFSPNPSNTARTGNWTEKDAHTPIAGTTQAVLVSTVNVGTPSSQAPTFTWMPYVSAAGQYNINLLVPGCTDLEDCALRTTVRITVFPGDGLSPVVTTVSQQNTDDATTPIYSGPVVPSSSSFSMTIIMALDDNPVGSGQDGQFELVADRVQLVLTSANVTGTTTTSGSNNSTASQSGFGFFEWPLSSTSDVNAASTLPSTAETSLDNVGLELLSALGGSQSLSSSGSIISAVAHHPSGVIFLGGSFNLSAGSSAGASNIVLYKNGQLNALPNNGLNGPVTSLVLDGDQLYVGGSFVDTASASTQAKLAGVAMYDIKRNQWSPLQAGLNGAVSSLTFSDELILAAGSFSGINSPSTGQDDAAGFAAWNVTSSSWVNAGGFLVGQMTFVGNSTASAKGQTQTQLLAGNVAAAFQFGASGFVMLQNGGNDGTPQITPLSVPLQSDPNASSSSPTKRSHVHNRRSSITWIPNISGFFKRQSSAATLAPLPAPAPATAPAVLAGAYWTNSSSSKEVVIIGGNFSFTASSGTVSQNVAIYDPDEGTLTALQGNQLNGTVRSLLVADNELFIGGTFTVQGTNFNGFAVYDLVRQEWDATGSQPLQGSSGSSVVVRSVTTSPSQQNTIIVAGSFAQAGSAVCRAICSYDIPTKQWSALGNGIQGEVASVAYAGNSQDLVIAAGSIALADGTGANVAAYTIANNTWSPIGSSSELPGPVTAMEVNAGNSSSIFAAGRSTDGSAPFLSFWNGQAWTAFGSSLAGTTDVSQMTMVPLQNTHEANSIVESDRMLWISGSLSGTSFGNVSSALFDGEQIIPYIVSASSSGTPGTIASLFFSISNFSFTQRHFLATGIVILISIAIAAGVVFFLALIGILWTLFSRKDDKIDKFDPADIEDDDSTTHRPSSLLEHINAATRTTILGQSPFGPHDGEKSADAAALAAASADPFGPDASNYVRAETPSDAAGGILGSEEIRPAHARYSFDGAGEGELAMTAGQDIEILDDGDAAWWYARDMRTGKEGVVPASYVY